MSKNTVKLRSTMLGEGRPKMAVPITGTTESELVKQATKAREAGADLIEWRIDYFEGVQDEAQLTKVGDSLREALGETALLVTFRTMSEGGELELSDDDYFEICKKVLAGNYADALDVERYHDETKVKAVVEAAHANGVKVVMSNHHFHETPDEADIVARLTSMAEFGADVPKIAVMPTSVDDVLTLLTATHEANEKLDQPIITMSMGDLGKVSRLSGEVFGSCLTFATVGAASAPGQISLAHLKNELEDLKLS
ncbi:hypothetical protein C5L31_001681 [Secundilactobacillus malefermentans]|uniref:3-dehydroquinate dehydratase n=2 Tax=Secundilactobacillus malefermentans TaxID=176292 RepID=A0A4R5NKK8_9LACO|nr:type I 3-dehydroquinate dehydratase [Secundilactobacillus malefermentans]TDG75051.1 hypothetical protein C5L31_001681 [Secundilactobacillus malefermentans]